MAAEDQIEQLSANLDEALRANQRQLVELLKEVKDELESVQAHLYRIENAVQR